MPLKLNRHQGKSTSKNLPKLRNANYSECSKSFGKNLKNKTRKCKRDRIQKYMAWKNSII